MYITERNRLLFSNDRKFSKKSLFTTTISRDERLCLFRKKQTTSVLEDETTVLLHVLGMSRLEKELYNSINELCSNFKKNTGWW